MILLLFSEHRTTGPVSRVQLHINLIFIYCFSIKPLRATDVIFHELTKYLVKR